MGVCYISTFHVKLLIWLVMDENMSTIGVQGMGGIELNALFQVIMYEEIKLMNSFPINRRVYYHHRESIRMKRSDLISHIQIQIQRGISQESPQPNPPGNRNRNRNR